MIHHFVDRHIRRRVTQRLAKIFNRFATTCPANLLDGFLAVSPVELPDYLDLHPDSRTLAMSIGALALAGLVAGSVPAFIGGRVGPSEVLKESGRGNSGGNVERRWVGILVAAEIALTLTMPIAMKSNSVFLFSRTPANRCNHPGKGWVLNTLSKTSLVP